MAPTKALTADEILAALAATRVEIDTRNEAYARRKELLCAGRSMVPPITHEALAQAAGMNSVQVIRDTKSTRG